MFCFIMFFYRLCLSLLNSGRNTDMAYQRFYGNCLRRKFCPPVNSHVLNDFLTALFHRLVAKNFKDKTRKTKDCFSVQFLSKDFHLFSVFSHLENFQNFFFFFQLNGLKIVKCCYNFEDHYFVFVQFSFCVLKILPEFKFPAKQNWLILFCLVQFLAYFIISFDSFLSMFKIFGLNIGFFFLPNIRHKCHSRQRVTK